MEKLKVLAERFQERAGGYTRITRAGFRKGDAAPVAVLEYINGRNDLRFQHCLKTEAKAETVLDENDAVKVKREKLKYAKRLAKLKAGQGITTDKEWSDMLEKQRLI